MRTHQRIWRYLQQHRLVTMVLGHVCVLLVLATVFFGSGLGSGILGALARSSCASGDQAYMVRSGDTLGAIASRYDTTWQNLASHNQIRDPNVIYVNELICIPGKTDVSSGPQPVKGTGNYFPPGQCTSWANERYHQLFGIYVPWTTQSNAWQWGARARDFHWKISSKPSKGAIIDLQPWVQGAYDLGHVAVVEKILDNGHVITSNLNWGARYWEVVDVEFVPGPGVSFISFK